MTRPKALEGEAAAAFCVVCPTARFQLTPTNTQTHTLVSFRPPHPYPPPQALMAAVGLQRREAEDALKLTGGDVAAALGHQLGRSRTHTAALDALVWEYATAR